MATGGGVGEPALSDFEEYALNTFGRIAVDGHPNVNVLGKSQTTIKSSTNIPGMFVYFTFPKKNALHRCYFRFFSTKFII